MSEDRPALRAPKVVTTVKLSRGAWQKLRDIAEDAALRDGGKPNASAVIESLIARAST